MLEEPRGFSLLVACQPYEQAREIHLHSGRRRGVFTYSLMATLRHGLSSIPLPKAIYDGVCAKVRDEFPDQTPHFMGEPNHFFGQNITISQQTLTVRRLFKGAGLYDQLELSGGCAHGVVIGSLSTPSFLLGPPSPPTTPCRSLSRRCSHFIQLQQSSAWGQERPEN